MDELVIQYDLYKCRLNIDFFSDYSNITLNRSNRSKHEIISDILRAIDLDGTSISGIQYKTYISYQHLRKYLAYLVQIELIAYIKVDKRFRITPRGHYALDAYDKLDELLVRTAKHKVIRVSEYYSSFP